MTAIEIDRRKRWDWKEAAQTLFAVVAIGLFFWAAWGGIAHTPVAVISIPVLLALACPPLVRAMADAWTRSGLPKSAPRSPLELMVGPRKPEPAIVHPRLDPILALLALPLLAILPVWVLRDLTGQGDWLKAAAVLPCLAMLGIGFVRHARLLGRALAPKG